jgi:hypothetical protein
VAKSGGREVYDFYAFLWKKFSAFSFHVLKAFISQDFKLLLLKIDL